MLGVLILFAQLQLHADSKRAPASLRPLVWTGGQFDHIRSKLPAKGYRFRDDQDEARELHADGLLTPGERDKVFHRLNLEAKLKAMDDLDKDILLIDSQFLTPEQLRRQYPTLTAKDLSALKSAIEAFR